MVDEWLKFKDLNIESRVHLSSGIKIVEQRLSVHLQLRVTRPEFMAPRAAINATLSSHRGIPGSLY